MRARANSRTIRIPSTKKTVYHTRGKVHLLRTGEKSYCGLHIEDVNHTTTLVNETTCQKCLMVMTGTWKKKS